MLLAFSYIAYLQSSIYSAIAGRQVFIMSLTILMTGVLLLYESYMKSKKE
ncbi:hypothetical protein [Myxosarcina sp. GI1(2024)]